MSEWLAQVPRVLWLALPVMVAAAAQIAVIKLDWLRFLKGPIDGGRSFRGRRLFGDNKTWRGAWVYVGVTVLAILPQGRWRLPELEYFDYGAESLPLAGFLLGLGWVLGELPNSFLKRQLGIAPGQRGSPFFVLLDQVDSLIGCLLLLCFLWVPPWQVWVVILVLCSGLHMVFNGVFVLLGLKKSIF